MERPVFNLPVKIFKMHDDVVEPSYGSEKAIGLDIRAHITRCDPFVRGLAIQPGRRVTIPTGIKMAFYEEGWYARIAPRSGLAVKHGVDVLAGVIDSDYRGEIKVVLVNLGKQPVVIKHGEKIAQIIFESADRADIEFVATEAELGNTARGEGGFGSTGQW